MASCAHSLKSESDIRLTPDDFVQKIEDYPVPVVPVKTADQTEQNTEKNAENKSDFQNGIPIEDLKKFLKRVPLPAKIDTKTDAKKATKNKKSEAEKKEPSIPTWSPFRWPFGIGEKITLVLRYGPLEGGIATLTVMEPKIINGETVMHYQGHVKSSKVLELFYKVDDLIDSWVGIGDHLPRRTEIRQNESGRWGRRIVIFDQNKSTAKFYSNTTLKEGNIEEIKREDPVASFSQDVFGALYFYRFATDNRINFPIHDRFRNWANELTFLGKEKIRVPAGEFDTLRYKMFPRVSGQLEPKGDVEIWIMDDPSRVMVQFKAKIKVGNVTGELKEYVPGVTNPFDLPHLKTPIQLPSETAPVAAPAGP